MEKLYYQDTYLSRITCTVTDVSRSDKATEIRTDRTIFYPESGGQPGDRGKLGQYSVLDTRKADDGDSVLILEPEARINKGDVLELVLDWDHRYKFMVIHAAQHMLSGLLFTMFGIGTVAVHQGDEYLTIETDRSAIDGSIIDELVLAANERIRENHEIIYHEMSHKDAEALGLRRSIKVEGDVRIVEIKDVDRIACGGIHVARTGEIGIIYCLGHEQIRGHVRLYFSCGRQAIESLIADSKVIRDLNRTFSCRTDEIMSKVAETLASLSEAKAEAGVAMRRLALTEVRDMTGADGICIMECAPGADLQNYAQAVLEFDDIAMLVTCHEGGRTKWLIALKGRFEKIDFNSLIRPLLAEINAKGGGRSPVFQGVAACDDKERIKDFSDKFRTLVGA
ncbi:MAG: alanyl-tRNA editing protein [Spirochaetales bacterium]|nr:alanyl-tRNA editing protein [Spirochaetales bacterium]MBR0520259.1 alanyl-tRNA editing protein [Spirochaetales bacterium]